MFMPCVRCGADYSMFAQIHTNGNLTVHNGTTGAIVAYTAVQNFAIDSAVVPALAVGTHAEWRIHAHMYT
eukprot:366552-Chlamydomonas_euryale.AAC.9